MTGAPSSSPSLSPTASPTETAFEDIPAAIVTPGLCEQMKDHWLAEEFTEYNTILANVTIGADVDDCVTELWEDNIVRTSETQPAGTWGVPVAAVLADNTAIKYGTGAAETVVFGARSRLVQYTSPLPATFVAACQCDSPSNLVCQKKMYFTVGATGEYGEYDSGSLVVCTNGQVTLTTALLPVEARRQLQGGNNPLGGNSPDQSTSAPTRQPTERQCGCRRR